MDDDDKSNNLLDAARGLAKAFSDLLNSLKPGDKGQLKVKFLLLCLVKVTGIKQC